MRHKGLVIYKEELSNYWIERLRDSGLNLLGIHPVGGLTQGAAVEEAIEWIQRPETEKLLDKVKSIGMDVEYEMHALSWLLPRELFNTHPEWFRMNESGERTPDYNFCPSNKDALQYLTERAAVLAKAFKPTTGRYHFWSDDTPQSKCHCSKCQHMTPSDASLTICNAITEGVRSVDSNAAHSYLAYMDTLEAPEHVKPAEGVFLEFAPMWRNLTRPLNDPESATNRALITPIEKLLQVFGTKNAQALDYWGDNTWFSDWKLPMRRFRFWPEIVALDSIWYEKQGFETVTSFCCYLGEEYYKMHGEHFDVHAYSQALGKLKDK